MTADLLAAHDTTFPFATRGRAAEGDEAAAEEIRRWNQRRREIGEATGRPARCWGQYNPATGGWTAATPTSAWDSTELVGPWQVYPGLSQASAERGAAELRLLGTPVEVWPIW